MNHAVFKKLADVIILETPTPLVSSHVSIRQPPPPLKSADVLYGWSQGASSGLLWYTWLSAS